MIWRAALAPCALAGLFACHAAPGTAAPAAAPARGVLPPLERRVAAFVVADSQGRPYTYPLLGGLDRPRPQLVDIDGDADLDLFVQEYPGQMAFFERTGEGAEARYTWRTDRYQNLDIGEWSRFVDVDSDGDVDLLAEERYSFIRYYRNDGTPSEPKFALAADTVKDVAGKPIFADRQNIPQVADVDCNGRLDLFLGRVDGTITRYEMAEAGTGGEPRFAFVTNRFEDIQIIGQLQPSRHGANTMAIVDVDSDNDPDILWGDFFEPGLLWIRNTGRECADPYMGGEPVPFPTNAPIRTSGYNAPVVGDLDGDGDHDLLVGVLGGAFDPTLTARNNLYRLEQTEPGVYRVRTTRFLDGLDVGTESVPALADVDGDGDLDLLVGNKIQSGDPTTAALTLFENRGTPAEASLHPVGQIPVARGYQYAPALGDLDGDGDPDLVLGTWQSSLLYYRNDATADGPRFTPADTLVRLTRGSHASPALADLDDDGDLDLLVGEASGSINYYRNDGSAAAPRFVLVSDEFEGINAGRRSAPLPVDLDGDGDRDLIVGNESGRPLVYENIGSAGAPAFERDGSAVLRWPPYGAPAGGDLDADGDVDLLVGNGSGGVWYFENQR